MQLSELRRLRSLHLSYISYEGPSPPDLAEAYRPLEALAGTLQRLRLDGCDELPPCLGQLTALRGLTVFDDLRPLADRPEIYGALLEAALPQLRQLTSLALVPTDCGLQRLPPGGWLASLRRLAANQTLLAASLPALSAAGQLQQLAVVVYRSAPHAIEVQQVARWAAGQPALQQLSVDTAAASPGGSPGCSAAAWAQQARAVHSVR